MMNSGSSNGKSTKRRRKEPGDSRAERKRELDRIAQRATRERTKNRIADLEQRLASLESGDKNSEIAQLTKTIGELRQENGRYQNALVKMRFAINEALADTEGSSSRRESSSTAPLSPTMNADRSNSVAALSPEETSALRNGVVTTLCVGFPAASQTHRLQPLYDVQGYRSPTPHEIGNFDMDSIYEFFEYGTGNLFTTPSPLAGRMPPEGGIVHIAPDEHKWRTSDDAFRRGLQTSPLTIDLDEGLLVKAILLGWESIGAAAQHPILFALQAVDQRVFGKWTSRPQRLALMYICGCAMRWRSNPTDVNRSKVPPWFLPRPAQEKIAHPLVIDFLVWPGLRERLVFEYEKYTIDGELSYCFVEYFHFHWPYPDEQVAQYDLQSGLICGLSNVFREFVSDLKNWTMLPGFFDSFPEMKADIEMWIDPSPAGYHRASWS